MHLKEGPVMQRDVEIHLTHKCSVNNRRLHDVMPNSTELYPLSRHRYNKSCSIVVASAVHTVILIPGPS